MNILLLTFGVPYPPDRGPRVKTYQLLRHLAGRHRVTLVCLEPEEAAPARAAALRSLCAEIHSVAAPLTFWRRLEARVNSLLGSHPALIARVASPALHNLVRGLVDEAAAAGRPFDLVHVDQIVMAQFAEELALPRLLDAHNAFYRILEHLAGQRTLLGRLSMRREAAQMRAYEGRITASFEAVAAVTEDDRDALVAAAGVPRPVHIIPLGVDGQAIRQVQRAAMGRAVLSLAAPGWAPNAEGIAWYAREVHPLVRRAVPDSELRILGAEPAASLWELSARLPGITVTGFVDPHEHLREAAVIIAPLRSRGGMRVALLESLARGIPVVATSLAAVELELRAGEHLLVADSPSEFADAVTLLLSDPELGEQIGAAARRRVLERHDWRALTPAVDSIYARMIAPADGSAEEVPGAYPLVVS